MQTMPRLDRWTRAAYERLAELGAFEGKPVELIGGQIVEMSPKGPRHEALTELVRVALAAAFPADRAYVRTAAPLALGEWDEPAPDAAVVLGSPRDYLTAHPTAAHTVLVVAVAETGAGYDLGDKADLYAAAGIGDYWVVRRAPRPDADSRTGVRYGARREYRPGDRIVPLAADLLP
jgi:Uma2 family endonuclease